MRTETEYLLQRASEEARRAISSEQPEAAEVHEELSIRYSAKAVMQLGADDEAGISADRPKALVKLSSGCRWLGRAVLMDRPDHDMDRSRPR